MKIYFSLSLDPRVLKDNLKRFKEYVSIWKKSDGKLRWNKEFEGKYRVYLPLSTERKITALVKYAVSLVEGKIIDYNNNKALDKHGRETSVGKLLQIATKQPGIPHNLPDLYASDPVRNSISPNDKIVVISRHPIDVASMSTGSHWASCMTIEHVPYIPVTKFGKEYLAGVKIEEDTLAEKLVDDIKQGTIVAYLIDVNDKTIVHPHARIVIKPFFNIYDRDDIILLPEKKHYGSYAPGFRETVDKWIDKKFTAKGRVYIKNPDLYNDDNEEIRVINQEEVDVTAEGFEKLITKAKEDTNVVVGDYGKVVIITNNPSNNTLTNNSSGYYLGSKYLPVNMYEKIRSAFRIRNQTKYYYLLICKETLQIIFVIHFTQTNNYKWRSLNKVHFPDYLVMEDDAYLFQYLITEMEPFKSIPQLQATFDFKD